MAEKPKNNADLYATFEHIERFHRRRMVFALHFFVSLGLQVTIWANWYGSYYVRGVGFEPFFYDRLIISAALLLLLFGHFVIMRLIEKKDRLVITALRAHAAELPGEFEPPPTVDEHGNDLPLLPFDDLDALYYAENRKYMERM